MEHQTAEIWVSIPHEVYSATLTLKKAGKQAFLVGGCVRDLLIGRQPKDWDITTDALPQEIQTLYPHTHYENTFGTVGVVFDTPSTETVRIIEITPFRKESSYKDHRHPQEVLFAKKIEEDLTRRDFTANAIALDIQEEKGGLYKGQIIDLYDGIRDLNKKLLRTVGNPIDRFTEDGLRILRAVRLATELSFSIDTDTERGIIEIAPTLQHISTERIRDELIKIIQSENPMAGFLILKKLNLFPYTIPELAQSVGVEQNKAHSYDVFEHLLRSLQHAAKKGYPLEVRLAALLHDIGKPVTRRMGENSEWTFYGHEVVGSKMAENILKRLKFPVKLVDTVVSLVRWHMFFSDTEKITLSAVRRIITKVGKDHIWNLMDVRVCDRIGTGRPKEDPYRLRKYRSMIEEALHDPLSVGMLAIDGADVMQSLSLNPGPKIGYILHALLEEVLEDPSKNKAAVLIKRATELNTLPVEVLQSLGKQGKDKKDEQEQGLIDEIRSKYGVK